MRITTKILAAAALAVISVSSFAASVTWTGALTNVKMTYSPATDISSTAMLVLTGTGATCRWLSLPGAMTFVDSAAGNNANALFTFLSQAKKDGTSVSLTYDNSTTVCAISSYGR